tara:strand:+ start:3629 stop:3805 length:177 start_codon:yes stop_codon:yes gene_type:complete
VGVILEDLLDLLLVVLPVLVVEDLQGLLQAVLRGLRLVALLDQAHLEEALRQAAGDPD